MWRSCSIHLNGACFLPNLSPFTLNLTIIYPIILLCVTWRCNFLYACWIEYRVANVFKSLRQILKGGLDWGFFHVCSSPLPYSAYGRAKPICHHSSQAGVTNQDPHCCGNHSVPCCPCCRAARPVAMLTLSAISHACAARCSPAPHRTLIRNIVPCADSQHSVSC